LSAAVASLATACLQLPEFVKVLITCEDGELLSELRSQIMHPACFVEVRDWADVETGD